MPYYFTKLHDIALSGKTRRNNLTIEISTYRTTYPPVEIAPRSTFIRSSYIVYSNIDNDLSSKSKQF